MEVVEAAAEVNGAKLLPNTSLNSPMHTADWLQATA